MSTPTQDALAASTIHATSVPMDTSNQVLPVQQKKARRKPSKYNEFIQKVLDKTNGDPAILQLPNSQRMKAAAKKWQESKKKA